MDLALNNLQWLICHKTKPNLKILFLLIFLNFFLFLRIIFISFQRYYIPTSRQLKRIESITRSHVFSHFSETLSGTSCIRAFKVQKRFHLESLKRVDKTHGFLFANYASNR